MATDWSRRALLASVGTAIAGCTGGPGTPTTDGSTEPTDDDVPSSTPPSSPTPSGGVERLPADHPGLAWALRLPEPVSYPPAADPDGGRAYVATGEHPLGTPTDERDVPSGAVFALRTTDGEPTWHAATDPPVSEGPFVHDGRVHVVVGYSNGLSGVDQRIVAYDRNGGRRWATDPTRGFLSILGANEGVVFAGTRDDALGVDGQALFAFGSDGDVRWEREAGDATGATVAEGRLLYGAGWQALASYDPGDGTKEWQSPGEPLGNPTTRISTFEGLCFTESGEKTDDGYPLVARSIADGTEEWRYSDAPASGVNFVPTGVANVPESIDAANYDHPLVATEYGGTVFALSHDGNERWTFTADADARNGPVVGDAVYVADSEGTVYALEPYDGSERWRASLPRFAHVRPLESGVLAFSLGKGKKAVASFRRDGTERWRYTTSKDLTPPVVAGNRAYAAASDGTVLAFAAE